MRLAVGGASFRGRQAESDDQSLFEEACREIFQLLLEEERLGV